GGDRSGFPGVADAAPRRRGARPGPRARRPARGLPAGAHPQPGADPARRPGGLRPGRRGPRLRGPGGARRHLGLRRRGGPHAGVRRAGRRAGRRGRPGQPPGELRAGGAGRRAGARRRHLGLGVRAEPVRRAGRRADRPAHRMVGAGAGRRRRRPRRRERAAGAGEQVLRRPGRHGDHPAAGPGPPGAGGDRRRPVPGHVRDDAHGGPAGRPGLGIPHRRHLGLGRRAGPHPRVAGREGEGPVGRPRPVRPGRGPVEPLADHPRVDRTRHRARPGAGLRGGVRGDVVRDLRQARHPEVRLAGDERDRRPHRRARPGHDRLRRRRRTDPAVGHRQGRHAGGLPAGPADGEAQGPGPLQRLRVRGLPGPHPGPADGQRVHPAGPGRPVAGGPDRRRGARHLRGRRQELVDRHAALQLPVHRAALLPDREREAGRPVAGRGLPGDDHRLLGLHGGGGRAGHVRPARRLQLRQGAAGAGGGGQPRRPAGAVPRREHPQHGPGGWPM
ncbi:MAG: TldD family protein, Actinobacterial subgroup, partial [uncultured Corynebacteriales bacterium]